MFNPRLGAKNLLLEAIGVSQGQSLAIIAEDPTLNIYDPLAVQCIAEVAQELGLQVECIPVADPHGMNEVPEKVMQAFHTQDHVLFQASLGDTLRFTDLPGRATKTMSYALDLATLGSTACTTSFHLLRAMQAAFEAETDQALDWHIRCPYGTDLSGQQALDEIRKGETVNFTVTRFPVCAPRPISCATANGVVALNYWLIGTDNHPFDNDQLLLDEPVMAVIENGRLVDLQGRSDLVHAVRSLYIRVGELFSMDPWDVHSWHAGMNPGAFYPFNAINHLKRWGKIAFANPRYLHFHTLGNYAPGEVTWSVFDATITMGGQTYWEQGRYVYLDRPETHALFARYDQSPDALPIRTDIGISKAP